MPLRVVSAQEQAVVNLPHGRDHQELAESAEVTSRVVRPCEALSAGGVVSVWCKEGQRLMGPS